MTTVLTILGALAVLVLMAWAGLRLGRRLRRSAGLALALLGIGVVVDPPSRDGLESVTDDREKGVKTGNGPAET